MRHRLALPSCALLLCLVGGAAMAAGLDAGSVGGPGLGIDSQPPSGQWLDAAPRKPILPRPPPPLPARRYLTQAEPPAAPAEPAAPALSLEQQAAKAEIEKRWEEAERLYREALEKQPDRVDLLLHLADVLAVQNKRLEAAQALGQAAELRPTDTDLQLHASEAFGAADHPKEAARYNDRALALRPNDQRLLRRRADLAIWTGDNAGAVEALRALIERNPDDLKLRQDLAKVLGWQSQWDEAVKVLAGYVALHAADKEALLALARTQSAAGDSDAAQETLKRYRGAGGDEATYQQELDKVLSDINAPIRAEMEKRYGDAERMYREMLARQPQRVEVLLRLADLLATEGKRLEAAETMAKAAALKPDDADLQLRASQAYGAAGKLPEAIRYADRALALHPDDPKLRQQRAELDVWGGKFKEAEKTLRALIAAHPDDAAAQRELARVLVGRRRLPEAAALLSQYVAKHPEDKEAVLDLARVNAARGKPRENEALLKLYRDAGGDEATFRREVAKARPAAPAAAARRAAAARAPAPSAPGNIPPAVIAAEGAKRYDEAVRILRTMLAREPGRVDLWLRLVDNLAAQKKPVEAAEAMAKAADLRPQDADLQLRASMAWGAADRPKDALRYVNRALALRPNDLDLHRRRAQLATWAGDNAQAEESLRVLIAADVADLKLKLNLGQVVGWQDRLDEAAGILSDYVAQRPTEKEGLLALSRVEAGRGDTAAAVGLLQRYQSVGGDDLTYRRDLALDLAWGSRIFTPLAIADAGLAHDPGDFQFHFARAVALLNGYEYGAAAAETDRMAQLNPKAPELRGLRRSIDVPMRSYLQYDMGARWESDNVSAQAAELSYHQPLNDAWWVFAGGVGDVAEALRSSRFAPIEGGTTMGRGGGYVGAQARLAPGTLAAGRIGATGTGRDAEPTWQISADSRLTDDLRVQLANMRDLQILTPRSISLGITRIDTAAQVTYTPDLAWTLAGAAQEGEFSDNNHFWRVFASPRRAVLRTQHWNVDLGISGNWFGYTRNPPQDGYYSPSLYQHYASTAYIYYKLSEEAGVSFIMTYGANKDQTMRDFKFTQDYTAEATFGALSEWMLKVRGAYTNHGSLGPNFTAESVGMTLVKRF